MEVQPGKRAVVTAEHAFTARLLDEDPLDLAAAAVHRAVRHSRQRKPSAPAHERRQPVNGAVRLGRLSAGGARRRGLGEPPRPRRDESYRRSQCRTVE